MLTMFPISRNAIWGPPTAYFAVAHLINGHPSAHTERRAFAARHRQVD